MPKKVMVVDDSATFRTIIAVTLTGAGYDVVTACDGREALELLSGTSFHLFIIDLNMPRMGGAEFIAKMQKKERFANVPIVILAAPDEAGSSEEVTRVASLHWLEKGFTPAELISKVDSIVP